MRCAVAIAVITATIVWSSAQAEEHSFKSNGIEIGYLDDGKGEAVILLHGFGSSSEMWAKTPLAQSLSKEYRVISPDYRGHGRSAKPHDAKQYGGEIALDVIRLLDHLQLKKAHIVGYSMGATVAGKILVNHPDRLLSVTFGGGGPFFRPSQVFADAMAATAESLEQGKGIGPLLIALTPAGQPPPSPEQAEAISKQFMVDKDEKALAAVLRGQKGLGVTEDQLRANAVPVCFVYGSREGILKDNIAATLKLLPKAQVTVVEKGDHLSTLVSPEFRASVLEFLRTHRQ